MKIDTVGPILDRLSLLTVGFRVYQRLSILDPRAYLRNRRLRNAGQGVAIPPARLIMAVAGSPDIDAFLKGGQLAATSIGHILTKNKINLADFGAVLDFGCGCGRVLRFWKDLSGVELHGTDYNSELTDWCSRHLAFARIGSNQLSPPTAYPDSKFDFIYALSVFTHLPESGQLDWLNEFHRILRPGGFLHLTLHGAYYEPRLNESEKRTFAAGELVARYDYASGTNLCSVFHPEAYVRKRLTEKFEVVDFIPEGAWGNPRQDAWLFRRR